MRRVLQVQNSARSSCSSFFLCIVNQTIQGIEFEDDAPFIDDLLEFILEGNK